MILNLLTLLLYVAPLVWLCLRRKVTPKVFAVATQAGYVIVSLSLATIAFIAYHSHGEMFANAAPWFMGYRIVQPLIVGPEWHDGPLISMLILPLSFLFCPFTVLLPAFLSSYGRPRLMTVLQFVITLLHLAWSGLVTIALQMD
jgi:hypothetical protein